MMRVTLSIFVCLILALSTQGQSRLIDKQGKASFYSYTPVEDIQAENESVLGALDLEKGAVAVSMQMVDFHFPKALMEEHFNENYIESEKYPKATFTGTISGYDQQKFLNADSMSFAVTGDLTIHGVTKPLETSIVVMKEMGVVRVNTEFSVRVADHKIKIPKIVFANIAEEVTVKAAFNFNLEE